MKNMVRMGNSVVENQYALSNKGWGTVKSRRDSRVGKCALCLLFFVVVVLVSANAQASGNSFKTPREWFYDWCSHSGYNTTTALEMPYELASKLREFDEIGVFPMPNSDIKERTQKWIEDNIASPSKYYLKTLPKSKLQKDKILKQRQDFLEDKLGEIRKEIEEAYSRCEIYKLSKDRFDEIAKCYAKCVGTRAWKDVGVSEKSFREVLDKMLPICKLRNELYADIIGAQKVWFQELSVKNPVAANAARDRAEVNRLKAKVASAEAAADSAREQAEWAQAAANAARNEAAQAREDAERSKINANRIRDELHRNGINPIEVGL